MVFFSIAAYKRRAYLLPLWPPSAAMLAWMVTLASERIGGRALKARYAAMCIVHDRREFCRHPAPGGARMWRRFLSSCGK